MRDPLTILRDDLFHTVWILVVAGTIRISNRLSIAAKNRCNADCSCVAAIGSVDSFFVASGTQKKRID